jgi:hypothetical protein
MGVPRSHIMCLWEFNGTEHEQKSVAMEEDTARAAPVPDSKLNACARAGCVQSPKGGRPRARV